MLIPGSLGQKYWNLSLPKTSPPPLSDVMELRLPTPVGLSWDDVVVYLHSVTQENVHEYVPLLQNQMLY